MDPEYTVGRKSKESFGPCEMKEDLEEQEMANVEAVRSE